MSRKWTATDIPSLKGRRVLITGANSGIGYHTAQKLGRRGAEIILACRNRERGEQAIDRLNEDAPGINVQLALLDLASLKDIRAFAARELAERKPLHLLINNAGVMAPPSRLETVDGHEIQFGTNVLGHFALTALLMPALEMASAEDGERPRIVTIASIAHKRGRMDFNDLQARQSYSPMRSYQQSKLANLLFAFELDRRLRAANSRLMSVAAHPGVAETRLFMREDHSPIEKTLRSVASHAIGVLLNTDAEGALPTLYAATSPDVRDGCYYGPQGFQEMRGEEVGVAQVAPQARDAASAAKLWGICEELTGTRLM